jgi:hypothetical protein
MVAKTENQCQPLEALPVFLRESPKEKEMGKKLHSPESHSSDI